MSGSDEKINIEYLFLLSLHHFKTATIKNNVHILPTQCAVLSI